MSRVETHFSAIDGAIHSSRNFPNRYCLYWHFRNPSASSDTDTTLSLKQFDQQNDKNYVSEIPYAVFRIKTENIQKIAVPSAMNVWK
jgi:hypothetical protein